MFFDRQSVYLNTTPGFVNHNLQSFGVIGSTTWRGVTFSGHSVQGGPKSESLGVATNSNNNVIVEKPTVVFK